MSAKYGDMIVFYHYTNGDWQAYGNGIQDLLRRSFINGDATVSFEFGGVLTEVSFDEGIVTSYVGNDVIDSKLKVIDLASGDKSLKDLDVRRNISCVRSYRFSGPSSSSRAIDNVNDDIYSDSLYSPPRTSSPQSNYDSTLTEIMSMFKFPSSPYKLSHHRFEYQDRFGQWVPFAEQDNVAINRAFSIGNDTEYAGIGDMFRLIDFKEMLMYPDKSTTGTPVKIRYGV